MIGLVDYAISDSDDDSYESRESVKANIPTENKTNSSTWVEEDVSTENSISSVDSFSQNLLAGPSFLSSLPAASSNTPAVTRDEIEDELDELVKPKEWEVKVAKKHKKRLKKKDIKDSRETLNSVSIDGSKKGKKMIDAFGAIRDSFVSSDEDETSNHSSKSHSTKKGLLDMLPAPKAISKVSNKRTNVSLLPSSILNKIPKSSDIGKGVGMQEAQSQVTDDEELDQESVASDFFGLSRDESTDVSISTRCDRIISPSTSVLSEPATGQNNLATSDISHSQHISSSVYDNPANSVSIESSTSRVCSGESTAVSVPLPEGISSNDIIDVNLDKELGSNIRANLLKNLHNKSLAEAAIAHLPSSQRRKNPIDIVARRKHQITYLADMAVVHEERLAEQWSRNRQNRRMSAQKYGF